MYLTLVEIESKSTRLSLPSQTKCGRWCRVNDEQITSVFAKPHVLIDRPKVALTRESSKNFHLYDLILKHQLECDVVLLPLLEHSSYLNVAAVRDKFALAITDADIIVLTSPQAALEVVKFWPQVDNRYIKVASIGKKTSRILSQGGIRVDFTPTKENALSLAQELPKWGKKVIFPSSEIAQNTLVDNLNLRGFLVNRINIYNTHGAEWTNDFIKIAQKVQIVMLTSPSAAKIWADYAGCNFDAVVIGSTTKRSAEDLGFRTVTCVQKNEGCLDGLIEGLKEVLNRQRHV